jgi:NAD(P)-dependent dehydrogenase (short-subunit alcohol dehydrogenase family)
MTEQGAPPIALLVGVGSAVGDEIASRLQRDGYRVVQTTHEADREGADIALDAVVVGHSRPIAGVGFLDLPDEGFVDGLNAFLDLTDTLRWSLARLRPGGALVVLASRGYLGVWGGADEAAFSGATLGLMRAIALENTPKGIRANVVVTDFPPPARTAGVAGAVAFLVGADAEAVNGEAILTNGGQSLRRREARDKRREIDL